MYNLTIHFGPNATAWSFLFKDKEKAEAAIDEIRKHIVAEVGVRIEDDYGQQALVIYPIHGILLENMELGAEARIIRGLDNARGQARFNKRMSTDPELQQMQRGPSVLTPFPSGVRHQ
jgi:hypothetical protein